MTTSKPDTVELGDAINAAFRSYYNMQYEPVLELCDLILAARPDIADIFYLRGLALLRLGRETLGRNDIRRAFELAPHFDQLRYLSDPDRDTQRTESVDVLERHLEEVQKFKATKNFILSYPKCGRTWVALVLGKYALNGEESDPLDLLGITARRPDFSATEVSHDDVPRLNGVYRPRVEKSVYRDKRVIFLIRNPRDVVVSHYFQHAKRSKLWDSRSTYSGPLSDFIRSDEGSIANVVTFYNVWGRQRNKPSAFLLVRYEDLLADPHQQFSRMIEFLGWPDLGPDALSDAIEFGRFENMHELETRNTYNNPRLIPPPDGNPEGFKTRRGKIGGYVDYLDDRDIDYLDRYIDEHLDDAYACYKSPPV